MIHALENGTAEQVSALRTLMSNNASDKVEQVLNIFREVGVDKWAVELKEHYRSIAMKHLEDTAVMNSRKEALGELAQFLIQRDY
jgi:geranylgeranyl pyrophosphate synthase